MSEGSSNLSLYITIGAGGALTALLSVLHTQYVLHESFQIKSALRDFFIGVILVTLLYQIVPDTVTGFGSFFTQLRERMRGGSSGGEAMDYRMKIGVAPF